MESGVLLCLNCYACNELTSDVGVAVLELGHSDIHALVSATFTDDELSIRTIWTYNSESHLNGSLWLRTGDVAPTLQHSWRALCGKTRLEYDRKKPDTDTAFHGKILEVLNRDSSSALWTFRVYTGS